MANEMEHFKEIKLSSENTNQQCEIIYFGTKEFCDFSMTYHGKEYRIPSIYLCDKSDYFKNLLMVNGQLRPGQKYLNLPDNLCEGVSTKGLEHLLNYVSVNESELEETDMQVVFDAYLLSSFFAFNDDIKTKFMIEFAELHEIEWYDNGNRNTKLLTWKFLHLAKKYALGYVTKILVDYIITNIKDRVNKDDFHNSVTLSADDWRQLFVKLANK